MWEPEPKLPELLFMSRGMDIVRDLENQHQQSRAVSLYMSSQHLPPTRDVPGSRVNVTQSSGMALATMRRKGPMARVQPTLRSLESIMRALPTKWHRPWRQRQAVQGVGSPGESLVPSKVDRYGKSTISEVRARCKEPCHPCAGWWWWSSYRPTPGLGGSHDSCMARRGNWMIQAGD